MPQTRLDSREKSAIGLFYALHSTLLRQGEVLRPRLARQCGTAWRDWRLLTTLSGRISGVLVDSMTERDCLWLDRMLRESRVGVDIQGPVSRTEYVIVDARDLAAIVRMAAANECQMCLKCGRELRACPLRDMLLSIAPPPKIGDGSVCEYAHVNWDEVK